MKKKNIKIILNTAMTALLPLLMAYSLVGEKFHEAAGTLMFALFIAHHAMGLWWYRAVFKGRYTAGRIFQTALNTLLFVFMIMQPVNGILMSKHLYTFIDASGVSSAAVRVIHLFLAYWGFALMCLHAGTHLTVPLVQLKRSSKAAWVAATGILIAVSLYGCCAFIKRQLADYMLLKSIFVFFDYNEPRAYFFLDYAAIIILFAFIGYLIAAGLTKIKTRS